MPGYRSDKKTTVEECKSISTTFLRDHGYFCAGKWGGMKWTNSAGEQTGAISFFVRVDGIFGKIRFQYTSTDRYSGEATELDYSVDLKATPCHFGGLRWWFLCPILQNENPCWKRVGKLYLAGGKYFGCRHCYGLTYQSSQENDKRVNDLLRNPNLLLRARASPNDLGMNMVLLKAMFKLERKEERKLRQ